VLKNYLSVALRNIRSNKGYSFINIFGLALSLGLSLLIIQMIVSFTSFDRFFENKERIYRINTTRTAENEARSFTVTPIPLVSALDEEVPGIEASTLWGWGIEGNGICRGKVLPFRTNFAAQNFFQVFSFELDRGDPGTALTEPNSIVLTSDVATNYFGNDDPMGEVIQLGQWGNYIVTGVLKDTSKLMTHMKIKSLVSLSTLASLEKRQLLPARLEDWTALTGFFSYVRLKKGVSPQQVEDTANRLAASRIRDPKYRYHFWLQGLTDIVNGPDLTPSAGEMVPMAAIYVLSAVAFLLVISAAFNYTNLSIARALSRAREVGIRKVVGAKRGQLFFQFIGEAVVIAFLALGGAFVLYRALFIPLLYSLHPVLRDYFQFRETWATLALFFAFAGVTGIVAGTIPALHVSRFQPIQALRQLAGLRVVSRITTRKVLIVFQFGLSVVFVISTFVAIDQLRFIRSMELGLRTEAILSVPLMGIDFGIFRQKITQESGIMAVAGTERMPAISSGRSSQLTRRDVQLTKAIRVSAADAGFLSVFGVRLLAGANFSEASLPEGEIPMILNETAARELGYGAPDGAVNQVLLLKDGEMGRVVGVVKDFAHSQITREQGAFGLLFRPGNFDFAALLVNPADVKGVVERLQKIWGSFDSAAPFACDIFTHQIEDEMSGMKAMMKSIRLVSLLAVVVSCLGLLGIADYSSRIRRREIGIRKVCGAGEWSLVRLLSKGYLAMLGVAAGAAIPTAWWFNGVILSVYENERIVNLRPELFAAGAGIVAVLGIAVVLSQTVRAARANPVDIIRHE
jgi:putative ABC transport system permease protein